MPVTIATQNPFFATLVGSSAQTLTLNNCTALTVYSSGGTTSVATASQSISVQDGISLEMSPNSPFSFGTLTITPAAGATAYVVYLL
jgi:hypothetical protein